MFAYYVVVATHEYTTTGILMAKTTTKDSCYATKPYIQIPQGLFLSKEFKALSLSSRCLYFAMLAHWDWGDPDKAFVFTYDQIKEATGITSKTISKSIGQLMTHGFIEIPVTGKYPHNVSKYQIKTSWITKVQYPRINKG